MREIGARGAGARARSRSGPGSPVWGAALLGALWFVNGLPCKVLDLVPRHEQIVVRVLGPEYARTLTVLIGILEVCMALWVWSRIKPRLCAVTQIATIGSMNVIEFVLAPDLLLWGRANLLFATLLVVLIARSERQRGKTQGRLARLPEERTVCNTRIRVGSDRPTPGHLGRECTRAGT